MIEAVAMSDLLSTRDLASFCRLARAREEMSQRAAAIKWNLSYVTIATAETGKVQRPMDYLKALVSNLTEDEIAHALNLLREVDVRILTKQL